MSDNSLSKKYNIPTYSEYIKWARSGEVLRNKREWLAGEARPLIWSEVMKFSAIQELAFILMIHSTMNDITPSFLVISKDVALRLIEEEGDIPIQFEETLITYNPDASVGVSVLL